MMICTAGHVDHGKTSLVRLLTGCATDRLKEEIERGLTIELGFAPCFLGNNMSVGIVDVPGHEKFIKNMVAGVSGIGLTLLVIAADDGVMPQTVEHFQIMDLLGVRHGMVALTKIDLVDAATREARIGEIRAFLKGTWLEGCPVCPVSSETFEGYPEFYNTLVAEVEKAKARRRHGLFRMPVERTFNQSGFGSVIMGIPVDGAVRVGDPLELMPGGQKGRVRAMQRFGHDATEGRHGQCLALNIPDLGKTPPERGQSLCAPGCLRESLFFHVSLQAVPGLAKPLTNAENVKFHTGTVELPGKVYLLEDAPPTEGRECLATVALTEPAAAAPHDRFILRRASPAVTVAGGEILALGAGDRRPRKSKILERLVELRELFRGIDPDSAEGMDRKLGACLRWDFPMGATAETLSRGALLEAGAVAAGLERLIRAGRALALSDLYIDAGEFERLRAETERRVDEAKERKLLSVGVAELRGDLDWPAALWRAVAEDLERRGLVRRRGDAYILKGAVDNMPPEDRALRDGIVETYRRTGFHSPRPEDLGNELRAAAGLPPARIDAMLRLLLKEGELIRLANGVLLHYDAFKRAQDLAVAVIREKGSLDSNEFKNRLETSRKYAIAFLEFLDARGVTRRDGNERRLTTNFEKNLL
jgi:selenocysteine-specific elongation factor